MSFTRMFALVGCLHHQHRYPFVLPTATLAPWPAESLTRCVFPSGNPVVTLYHLSFMVVIFLNASTDLTSRHKGVELLLPIPSVPLCVCHLVPLLSRDRLLAIFFSCGCLFLGEAWPLTSSMCLAYLSAYISRFLFQYPNMLPACPKIYIPI